MFPICSFLRCFERCRRCYGFCLKWKQDPRGSSLFLLQASVINAWEAFRWILLSILQGLSQLFHSDPGSIVGFLICSFSTQFCNHRIRFNSNLLFVFPFPGFFVVWKRNMNWHVTCYWQLNLLCFRSVIRCPILLFFFLERELESRLPRIRVSLERSNEPRELSLRKGNCT